VVKSWLKFVVVRRARSVELLRRKTTSVSVWASFSTGEAKAPEIALRTIKVEKPTMMMVIKKKNTRQERDGG